MSSTLPRQLMEIDYYEAAQEYERNLPLEHFMEAVPHATQRKITVESFDVIHAANPQIQMFSELLVQYPRRGKPLGQVVPDNMGLLHDEPIEADGSFDVPLQPVRPLVMLEYVSKNTKRKDYKDNMVKYEKELKVPFYLLFDPRKQELTLHRHNGRKFLKVKPNAAGRLAIPALEVEVALLDGWVRFWHRGELVALPAELTRESKEQRKKIRAQAKKLDEQDQQLTKKDQQLSQKNQQLTEQGQRLAEQGQQLSLKDQRLAEKDQALAAAQRENEQLRAQLRSQK